MLSTDYLFPPFVPMAQKTALMAGHWQETRGMCGTVKKGEPGWQDTYVKMCRRASGGQKGWSQGVERRDEEGGPWWEGEVGPGLCRGSLQPLPRWTTSCKEGSEEGRGNSRLPGCTWMEIETFLNVLTQLAGEFEGIWGLYDSQKQSLGIWIDARKVSQPAGSWSPRALWNWGKVSSQRIAFTLVFSTQTTRCWDQHYKIWSVMGPCGPKALISFEKIAQDTRNWVLWTLHLACVWIVTFLVCIDACVTTEATRLKRIAKSIVSVLRLLLKWT